MENRNSTGLAREQQLATTAWRGLCMGLGYFLVWMGPWIIIKNAYSMCITLIHYTAEKLSYFILLFRRCVSHTYTGCCLWNCNWFEIQIKFKKFFPCKFPLYAYCTNRDTETHLYTWPKLAFCTLSAFLNCTRSQTFKNLYLFYMSVERTTLKSCNN